MPRMDETTPAAWTTYFATDDAAASLAAITDGGGTVVVGPMAVGPQGTMAVALDPEGNGFGVWQAGDFIGAEIYNEPGGLVWNDAAVVDPAAAQTFYGSVFGWRFDRMEMDGGPPDYATFSTRAARWAASTAAKPVRPAGRPASRSVRRTRPWPGSRARVAVSRCRQWTCSSDVSRP